MNAIASYATNSLGLPIAEHEYYSPAILLSMGGWSLTLVIGIALLIILVLVLSSQQFSKHRLYKFISRHISKFFIAFWVLGFIVYDVGTYTGEPWSLIGNAPMVAIHAFEMFLVHSDTSAIHEELHSSWVYMSVYSFAHLMAAIISLLFVLKHFGFNIIAGMRMYCAAHGFTKKEVAYVFWGMNDATYYLAKDIKKHYDAKTSKKAKNNYRIIIVRTNEDNETATVHNGMERLFNFLSLKDKDLGRLEKLECLTTNTFMSITKLNIPTKETEILQEQLRLKSLRRIIQKKTTGAVHIFSLSEDHSYNIQAIANLKRDKTLWDFVLPQNGSAQPKKVTFYCRARYNSIHRVIEDEQLKPGLEVRVVDTAHISIELMKQNVELQPVSFVDIKPDATVSSAFNSLIVGFDEVGFDAVRFLYEFGAFVKHGCTSNHVVRSDFHCHVVDSQMSKKSGIFVANAPSIKPKLAFNNEGDSPKDDSLITLHEMDSKSTDFYEKLKEWITDLNYIVIAQDDDEQNIALGVRIFRMAVKYRKNLDDHFRILIRVKHDEGGHFKQITEHYNRLWKGYLERKSKESDQLERQTEVTSNEYPGKPLTLFGTEKDTYQFKYIVDESLKDQAKMYKKRYDESISALKRQAGEAGDRIISWDEESRLYMQLDSEHRGYSPTYSNVMKLRRRQSQNIENCTHKYTKHRLAIVALGPVLFKELTSHHLYRNNNEIEYHWKDHVTPKKEVVKVLDVLAQTEHLRWIASHEVLGYELKGNEGFQDEARLQHGCMVPWEDLTEVTKSYDYNVVDVSLNLIELGDHRSTEQN